MNYDQELNAIAEEVKTDKSIVQPWRNYALKAANEMQAFIKMGKTTSPLQPPPEAVCTCPPGGRKASCPVHRDTI